MWRRQVEPRRQLRLEQTKNAPLYAAPVVVGLGSGDSKVLVGSQNVHAPYSDAQSALQEHYCCIVGNSCFIYGVKELLQFLSALDIRELFVRPQDYYDE